jgi:hypothetical protein
VKGYVSLSSESDHAACNGQCLRYKLTRYFRAVDERSTPYQPKNIRLKAASFTLDDTVDLLLKIKACVGMFRYLDYTGAPNVNRRLTDVVNNVGDQWNHGQAVWNAANPNNQVFIGDFWSEWV